MPAAGNRLAWMDAETTGTVAHQSHLLEIACFITDTDGTVISDEPFHAVIGHSDEDLSRMYEQARREVQEMHTASGLWERARFGLPLDQVERELLAHIKRYCPEPDYAHIAGNTVRLDLNFIEEHMPSIADYLHYRMLDVSSLALLAKWHFGVEIQKASDHTALVDITESLEQLRLLWGPIAQAAKDAGVTFDLATPRARESTSVALVA
jgi:oligoribonuclease